MSDTYIIYLKINKTDKKINTIYNRVNIQNFTWSVHFRKKNKCFIFAHILTRLVNISKINKCFLTCRDFI